MSDVDVAPGAELAERERDGGRAARRRRQGGPGGRPVGSADGVGGRRHGRRTLVAGRPVCAGTARAHDPRTRGARRDGWEAARVKKLLELLVCFLHPLAVVLGWVDLPVGPTWAPGRRSSGRCSLIVPVVPFVYVLTGGDLW